MVENISEHVNPVTRSIRMATRNPLAKYRQSPYAKFPDAFTLVNYFFQTHVGAEVAESFMSIKMTINGTSYFVRGMWTDHSRASIY